MNHVRDVAGAAGVAGAAPSANLTGAMRRQAKAAAAKEIITITCVKGKLIKKVTAIKPVCPVGYKKK